MTTLTTHPSLSNMFGPLSADIITRLQDTLDNPAAHWDENYCIILRGDVGMSLTLWQAVIHVDPTFPRVGPSSDRKGRQLSGWTRIPDQVLLGRALKYAASVPAGSRRS